MVRNINMIIKIIYIATFVTIIGGIVGSTINSLFNIFTITDNLKVNSLVTLGQGILNIIIVFVLLSLNIFKGYEIVVISGVSVLTSIIKNLTFTPLYSAKCLNAKLTVFYKTIFNGVLSAIILIITFVVMSNLFNPKTWISLISCAIVCGMLGIAINYLVLLNKAERKLFIKTIKTIFSRGDKREAK